MGSHVGVPEIELAALDLREEVPGPTAGYVISADNVEDLVELWVDPVEQGSAAVANLRLTPEEAVALAEQILCAAERIIA